MCSSLRILVGEGSNLVHKSQTIVSLIRLLCTEQSTKIGYAAQQIQIQDV